MNTEDPIAAEESRLRTVASLHLMDSGPEPEFDELAQLAAQLCEITTCGITLIDDKRQYFKARVGQVPTETSRENSFCKYLLRRDELMEVPDASKDVRFMDHPSVTAENGVRFYAGVPLKMPDGNVVGSLFVIDTVPRELTETQSEALASLSRQTVSRMELRQQKHALEAAIEELSRTQQKLQEMNKHLEQVSLTDALTGLANRRAFDDALWRETARAKRKGTTLAVVMMDIDNFKMRNDRYGHPNGDEVLWQVGEILRTVTRQGDLAARYGGEEFILLLPETTSAGAKLTAERIIDAVHATEWDKEPVTLSMGIAAMGPEAEDKSRLVEYADEALYRAKRAGKDRVVVESIRQKS